MTIHSSFVRFAVLGTESEEREYLKKRIIESSKLEFARDLRRIVRQVTYVGSLLILVKKRDGFQ